mgnify:CR=1 FL=1
MSTKVQKNIRKMVIKNFNQNNTLKQLFMNKKFPKISFSNEMLTQSNLNNKKSIKLRNHTDQNLIINETNSLLKNNIKKDSITSTSYLNKIPKKEKKEKKYILKSEINKPERITDLDMLPFPIRDYRTFANVKGVFANVIAGRGCYGNCSFCSIHSAYEYRQRICRSPKNVVDEIDILVNK